MAISYSSFKTNSRKKAFANEIIAITNAVENYKLRNNEYPFKDSINIDTTSDSDELLSEMQLLGEVIINGKVNLYIVDLSKIDIENVMRGNSNDVTSMDVYAYSTNTHSIYYLKGEKIGDKTYYNYNEELYNLVAQGGNK